MCKWGTETIIRVLIPADLSHDGIEKWKEVGIDSCIASIVKALQEGGINMRSSCCGHGQVDGQIELADGRTITVANKEADMSEETNHPIETHVENFISSVNWENLKDPCLTYILGNLRGFAQYVKNREVSNQTLPLRPEVLAFAVLMEQQLKANSHKPGWKDADSRILWTRLEEESDELFRALAEHAESAEIAKEAADVANFAMMIADVRGALELP